MDLDQQENNTWIPPKFVCIKNRNLYESALTEFPSLKNLVKDYIDDDTVIVVDDTLKKSYIKKDPNSKLLGLMFANYKDFAVIYSKIYCYIFVGSGKNSDLKMNVGKFMKSILDHNG
jgi:hypothetical protein